MSYLFVGNLSKNVSEKVLHNLFSKFGLCVVDLKGPYAFVRYSTVEEANKAIAKYNQTNLDGINGFNKARIEFSKKNEDFLADKVEIQNNINNSINLKEDIDNSLSPRKIRRGNDNRSKRSNIKSKNNNMNNHFNNIGSNNHNIKDDYSSLSKGNITQNNIRAQNICFICKLPGHNAKECVLTKDTCYECGKKGHMAKECQAGVRDAKELNYNRVKAIFSQQSNYIYLTHKQRLNIYNDYLKNN